MYLPAGRTAGQLDDPLDRKIIVMRFFLTMSLKDISGDLKLDHAEVKKRYAMALRRMDKAMKGHI